MGSRRSSLVFCFVMWAATRFLAASASAQLGQTCLDEEEHLLRAVTPAYEDRFGTAVALEDEFAMVGAPQRPRGVASGRVHVFRYDGATWTETQELRAVRERPGAGLGTALSVDMDTIVVGARGWDGNGNGSGAAYIFRNEGLNWYEEARLTPANPAALDFFGESVAVSGSAVLIGAPKHDTVAPNAGTAYVFRHTQGQWAQEQILVASDGTSEDSFGVSVAIEGDLAAVGAEFDDDAGQHAGSAYVFRFDGTSWVEEQKLVGSDTSANDKFGHSICVAGGHVFVGAEDANSGKGAVYVYRHEAGFWREVQKVVARDGVKGDTFSESLAVDGDFLIVGAPFETHGPARWSGSAYVFHRDGDSWIENQKLVASNAAYQDNLGVAVAIDGSRAIVGAWLGDAEASNEGTAYAFDLVPFRRCRAGTVDLGARPNAQGVLRINGTVGDCEGVQALGTGTPIEITLSGPRSGPNPAPFVLYAWRGEPDGTSDSIQPFGLGTMCFPSFLSIGVPKPDRIWNNAGHHPLLGAPDFPSSPAPSSVFSLPSGWPRSLSLTFQGLIADDGSAAVLPASVTNAVILRVVE